MGICFKQNLLFPIVYVLKTRANTELCLKFKKKKLGTLRNSVRKMWLGSIQLSVELNALLNIGTERVEMRKE